MSQLDVLRRVVEVTAASSAASAQDVASGTVSVPSRRPPVLVGSGYLIGPRAVLTARHVLVAGGAGERQTRLHERVDIRPLAVDREAATSWARCSLAWESADLDVALLEVAQDVPLRDTVRLGEVEGDVPVRSIGFPTTETDEQGNRGTEVAMGTVLFGAGWHRRRLVVDVQSNVAKVAREVAPSAWRGMSGAPLLHEDVLVGVIVKDRDPARRDGHRLEAVPVSSVLRDATFIAAVSQLMALPCLEPIGRSVHPRLSPLALPADVIARPRLLAEVVDRALERDGGVVALLGPGGFGKTVLAEQAASAPAVAQRWPGGVLELTFDAGDDAEGMVRRRVADLTGTAAETLDESARRLGELLARRRALLLLDNVGDTAVAEVLFRHTPGVTRIVTSRLGSSVERWATATVAVDAPMASDEAVQLLTGGQALTEAEQQALEEFAVGIGGWPLLLGLAASRLRRMPDVGTVASVRLLQEQYDAHGAFGLAPRGGPRGQDLVARVLDGSLTGLDDEDRQRLFGLSIFTPGEPVPVEVVRDFWGSAVDVWALVWDLADRSLLRLHDDAVVLHDVLRDLMHRRLEQRAQLHGRLIAAWGRPPDVRGSYRVRHYARHLLRSEVPGAAAALCSPAWLDASLSATGTPLEFVADMRLVAQESAGSPADEARARLVLHRVHARHERLPPSLCRALARLGQVDRALGLAAVAGAQRLGGESYKAPQDRLAALLTAVASGTAARDPARAAAVARTVDAGPNRATALAETALAIVEGEPGLARELASEALQALEDAAPDFSRQFAAEHVVRAFASTAPAELDEIIARVSSRLADADSTGMRRRYAHPALEASLLAAAAEQVAGSDPDLALRLVAGLRSDLLVPVLSQVALALLPTKPERAKRHAALAVEFAGTGGDGGILEEERLSAAATALAVVDVEAATRYADGLLTTAGRARALIAVAGRLRGRDPGTARRLAELAWAAVLGEETTAAPSGSKPRGPSPWPLPALLPGIAEVDLELAERLARSLPLDEVPRALSEIAWVFIDGGRRAEAEALVEEALTKVLPQPAGEQWGQAVWAVLEVLAGLVPEDARRRVARVPEAQRRNAELSVAVGLAPFDPDSAEATIRSFQDKRFVEQGVCRLAVALSGTDPNRAARLASGLAATHLRDQALLAAARGAAGRDPKAARALVRRVSASETWGLDEAVASVAGEIALSDARAAEQFARAVRAPGQRYAALAAVGRATAAHEPARASRLADELLSTADRSRAGAGSVLAAGLSVLARVDQDRAVSAARRAHPVDRPSALQAVAVSVAPLDPAAAERIAGSAVDPYVGRAEEGASRALAAVALALVPEQPAEAVRLAADLPPTYYGAPPLLEVLARTAVQHPEPSREWALSIADTPLRRRAVAAVSAAAARGGARRLIAVPDGTLQLVADDEAALLTVVEALVRALATERDARQALQVADALMDVVIAW